jgi:hypothetical protein
MIRKARELDMEGNLDVSSHYNFKLIDLTDGSPIDDDYTHLITPV